MFAQVVVLLMLMTIGKNDPLMWSTFQYNHKNFLFQSVNSLDLGAAFSRLLEHHGVRMRINMSEEGK